MFSAICGTGEFCCFVSNIIHWLFMVTNVFTGGYRRQRETLNDDATNESTKQSMLLS